MSEIVTRDTVVSFRCTDEMAEQLAALGGDTQQTRSNVVFILLCAALNGGDCRDQIRVLRPR